MLTYNACICTCTHEDSIFWHLLFFSYCLYCFFCWSGFSLIIEPYDNRAPTIFNPILHFRYIAHFIHYTSVKCFCMVLELHWPLQPLTASLWYYVIHTQENSREFYSQHSDCVQTAKNQISFIEYMYNSIQFESVALHSMVMSLCMCSCMDAGIAIKPVFDYYTTVILTSAVR